MKVELFDFQKRASSTIRMYAKEAIDTYGRIHLPQIVSFTAPTGAGKTIIMSSIIEDIFFGDDFYPEQQNAIFVWLSDSPQLNEQSKDKIDTKADRIRLSQCIIISEDSFNQEMLDDGKIYFLNTQKLRKGGKLTIKSDSRAYTIWETLANTVKEKSDRLYFIIDEAHRGMQGKQAAEATTIMQKFLKGSPEDGLPAMPVVIGMSATLERFNNLVAGLQSTTYPYAVTTDEVRASGLLKDKIAIMYPKSGLNNEMAVLQEASDDWKEKWDHWKLYCQEQHETNVNPVFVVQVAPGKGDHLTETNLDDCLQKIEERTGFRFDPGEVVHTFGDTHASIKIHGLDVRYVEPSDIADDKKIKVVFFKENLSTGWDCPRAETMMSFCSRQDPTYIAQLLGRMIRTPLQRHIMVDDVLNSVHLYLPYYDKDSVKKVIDELQGSEGGSIPADVYGEQIGDKKYDILTSRPKMVRTPIRPNPSEQAHKNNYTYQDQDYTQTDSGIRDSAHNNYETEGETNNSGYLDFMKPETYYMHKDSEAEAQDDKPEETTDLFDRQGIIKFINDAAIPTNWVRSIKRSENYLRSLFALAHLLSQSGLYEAAVQDVIQDMVDMIHNYIKKIKDEGTYQKKVDETMQFELQAQVFNVFGESVDNDSLHDIIMSTDTDIDRQFRIANNKFCEDSVGNEYGRRYGDWSDPNTFEIEVILFTNDQDCMKDLNEYAEKKFHDLNDDYRRSFKSDVPEKYRNRYEHIVKDGDVVSTVNFTLPEKIDMRHESDGKEYADHLFVDEDTGVATIKLNSWEEGLLKEEEARDDFVCWIRNPSDREWGLSIAYDYNGTTKSFKPDFIIVRKDKSRDGYIIDILEPHRPNFDDNLGKAQGLAKYAQTYNPYIGRLQLIRAAKDATGKDGFVRLDMSKSAVRDKVLHLTTQEELNRLFQTDGFFD